MSIWTDIELIFEGKPEPVPHPIAGREMHGPNEDDVFNNEGDRVTSDIDGLTIGILYRDTRGQVSERVIRCREVLQSGRYHYINADCLLRNAPRTFRLDRIEEVIDYSTGEVLADVGRFFSIYWEEQASDLQPRLSQSATLAPTSDNPRIAACFRDGARVLLFLAMSDGHFHEAERRLVIEYGVQRLRRLETPPIDPEGIVVRWVDNHVPTRASALAALGRVSGNPDDGAELAHKMIDMIIADGTATDGEMTAAWTLVHALERREQTRPAPRRVVTDQ